MYSHVDASNGIYESGFDQEKGSSGSERSPENDGGAVENKFKKVLHKTCLDDYKYAFSTIDTLKNPLESHKLDNELETPAERISRIKNELEELDSYLKETVSLCPENSDQCLLTNFFDGVEPQKLISDINQLQNTLSYLSNEDKYKSCFNSDLTEASSSSKPMGSQASRIQLLAQELRQIDCTFDSEQRKPDDNKEITYELYHMPKVDKNIQLTMLEKRLFELESKLGINNPDFVFPDLSSAIVELHKRLNELNPSRVEILKKEETLKQIDQLLRKKADLTVSSNEEERMILELYDFFESVKSEIASLPLLVKRLKVLKMLHQEAGDISSRVIAIETQQVCMLESLKALQDSVNAMQASMHENIKIAVQLSEKFKSSSETS